jgi:hypothetical protein
MLRTIATAVLLKRWGKERERGGKEVGDFEGEGRCESPTRPTISFSVFLDNDPGIGTVQHRPMARYRIRSSSQFNITLMQQSSPSKRHGYVVRTSFKSRHLAMHLPHMSQ